MNEGGEVLAIRFSECQQKECIQIGSGRLLGYIYDAKVNIEMGVIEYFCVAPPKKFYSLKNKENKNYKVYINEIVIIGKDVILVNNARL